MSKEEHEKAQFWHVAKWAMEHKSVIELQILEILCLSRINELIETFNKTFEEKD